MHDPTLEPLINEVRIERIGCGQARRQTPHFKIECGQCRLIAWIGPRRIGTGDSVKESRLEVDRHAVPVVRHVQIDERQSLNCIVLATWCRRRAKQIRIGRRQTQPVDASDWQDVRIQDVGRRDGAVWGDLEHLPLEQLDASAEERELARDGVAERANAAAMLEVIQDGGRPEAIPRGREEARVCTRTRWLSGRQCRLAEHRA